MDIEFEKCIGTGTVKRIGIAFAGVGNWEEVGRRGSKVADTRVGERVAEQAAGKAEMDLEPDMMAMTAKVEAAGTELGMELEEKRAGRSPRWKTRHRCL